MRRNDSSTPRREDAKHCFLLMESRGADWREKVAQAGRLRHMRIAVCSARLQTTERGRIMERDENCRASRRDRSHRASRCDRNH